MAINFINMNIQQPIKMETSQLKAEYLLVQMYYLVATSGDWFHCIDVQNNNKITSNVSGFCPGPNFIALLTGKQIFVLTIAENFA